MITEVEDCVLIEATECSYRNRNDESDGDEWFPSDTQLLLRLPLKEHGKKHHTGELRFDVDGAAWAILPKDQLIAKQVAQVATT